MQTEAPGASGAFQHHHHNHHHHKQQPARLMPPPTYPSTSRGLFCSVLHGSALAWPTSSNLFGLVKRETRHVFEVGELERSRSTHTTFLLRSIKHLAKGESEKQILRFCLLRVCCSLLLQKWCLLTSPRTLLNSNFSSFVRLLPRPLSLSPVFVLSRPCRNGEEHSMRRMSLVVCLIVCKIVLPFMEPDQTKRSIRQIRYCVCILCIRCNFVVLSPFYAFLFPLRQRVREGGAAGEERKPGSKKRGGRPHVCNR